MAGGTIAGDTQVGELLRSPDRADALRRGGLRATGGLGVRGGEVLIEHELVAVGIVEGGQLDHVRLYDRQGQLL